MLQLATIKKHQSTSNRAIKYHPLKFGSYVLDSYLFSDGRSLIGERSLSLFLGGRGGGAWKRKRRLPFSTSPVCLTAVNLSPYLTPKLLQDLVNRVSFVSPKGHRGFGYPPAVAIEICEVWLQAHTDNRLLPKQIKIARRAVAFLKSLAHIGLITLTSHYHTTKN